MANLREKDIIEILKEFRERTSILSSVLFTEDGLIIALDQAHINEDDDDYPISFGAICAGIIALVENGVEEIKEDSNIKSISIQAGQNEDNEGFTIILQSIKENIKLSVIFPVYLNFGLIYYELQQTSKKLSEYFSSDSHNENLEGMSTFI